MTRLSPPPTGLKLELASTQEDLEQAYRLLHQVYVEMGFMEPDSSGLRVNVYNMLPHTSTVVAKVADEVIGTVTLIRENPLRLPLDESIDTSFYRKPGWQVAEVTGLAVSSRWRERGQILFPLLKYLYQYAVHYAKVDVLQIATALSKEDFFRALLFFEPISDATFRDPLINGTWVKALYLDLSHAKTLFKRSYSGRSPESDLYAYFTHSENEMAHFAYPDREVHHSLDPVMTPMMFKYFFKERTNMVERLSDRDIHVLRDIYRDSPVARWLKEPNSAPPFPPRRASPRFMVHCPAYLEKSQGDEAVMLLDVSETGFRLFSRLPVRFSGVCGFRIQLADNRTVPLTAKPVWNRRRREWGFSIVEAPRAWREFLAFLEKQIQGKIKRAS